MNYLLDTNIVSELRKKKCCDLNVMSWFQTTDDQCLYLSVLVTGEIRKGIEFLKQRDLQQSYYLGSRQ